ncbi:hypothetical protein D3C80_767360 [compost metagenome]
MEITAPCTLSLSCLESTLPVITLILSDMLMEISCVLYEVIFIFSLQLVAPLALFIKPSESNNELKKTFNPE